MPGTGRRSWAMWCLCLFACGRLSAQSVQAPPPLFADHSVLGLTIEADFDQLRDDRGEENEERPALVRWVAEDGSEGTAQLKVRTRGNFRLQRRNCPMPPIRLNFPTRAMEGTLFEGQDKLKLVTHCRDRDNYEQNVLEEYTVYRLYNEVTEASFRVRPARLTYIDVSGEHDPVTRYGFLIEDEDHVAGRLDGRIVDVPAAHPRALASPEAPRMALFQYMVGNTDWSMVQFHNMKLVQQRTGRALVVPYDFDWSGLVSAPYARPDATLNLRTVRQRAYRGFCREGLDFEAIYALFRERQERFRSVIGEVPGLTDDNRRKISEYLDSFYEVIDDQDRSQRRIERSCRSMGSD